MTEPNESSEVQLKRVNDEDKIACHLVSLPTILLTRVDEERKISLKTKSSKKKMPSKNVTLKNKKTSSLLKPLVNKNSSNKSEIKRSRGRPRKEQTTSPKSKKTPKKSIKNESTTKKYKTVDNSKIVGKSPNSAAKTMLKKTMLQKKSKIAIPQAKKPKLIKKTISKQTPVKVSKLNPAFTKVDTPLTKHADSDTSEDEFLYDELIDEFENTFNKNTKLFNLASEKTTNITLKPSTGNKPPTIVKGGIIKMNSLPADLKTIASPGQQLPKNKINESSSQKRSKLPNSDSPVPSKKPSPWPISRPSNKSSRSSPNKNKKKPASNTKSVDVSIKPKTVSKTQQDTHNVNVNSVLKQNEADDCLVVESKPISVVTGKPKIGPKQTAKVGPMSKPFNEEDNLSDEYTEEETLENIDYIVDESLPKHGPLKNKSNEKIKAFDDNTPMKSTLVLIDNVNDDDDPNIDLLRILTDDTENCTSQQLEKSKETCKEISFSSSIDKNETDTVNEITSPKESLADHQIHEEPQVRTIYDLINEVSLQRPSWNLHIIPETNAFCIAQVTMGRLGLPTLKKCIELDPVDYNAKVYIHQYHIKRFDGIYESEESILALIEEIDSIKA